MINLRAYCHGDTHIFRKYSRLSFLILKTLKGEDIRPVTRILCGGVLTRPKWTKLPKYIFYCRSVYKQCGIVKKVHIGFSYNIVMTSGDDDKRRRET